MTEIEQLKTRTAHEVWDHHNQSLAARNIDEFIKDFAQGCVFLNNPQGGHASGVFIGPKGVRDWCRQFFALFDRVTEFHTKGGFIHDDGSGESVVMVSWTIENAHRSVTGGVDTFIVREGQFHIVTVVYEVRPKNI